MLETENCCRRLASGFFEHFERTMLQTMMSTVNPFIGRTQATKIDTPVVWMTVQHCDDAKRRKRRSSTPIGLTHGSSARSAERSNRLLVSKSNSSSAHLLRSITHHHPSVVTVSDKNRPIGRSSTTGQNDNPYIKRRSITETETRLV